MVDDLSILFEQDKKTSDTLCAQKMSGTPPQRSRSPTEEKPHNIMPQKNQILFQESSLSGPKSKLCKGCQFPHQKVQRTSGELRAKDV